LIHGTAFGAGFQLYTEGSTEALGQAGAISGRDDLISLAWYNPAALAGTEQPAVMAGVTFAQIKTDYINVFSSAANASMSDDWRTIPHLYYVQPINERWTTMLSVNAPYGLITEWPDGWAGAQLALLSDLESVYITPSVAWQAMENLSIGAGVNVVNATAELSRFEPAPPVGPPGDAVVEGDDISYGGTVSAHYQPFEDWGFGVRYQSRVKLEITGSSSIPAVTLPASADLELPSTVNVGVANRSIGNLKLGLDLVWTEWSTYEELRIETPAATVTAPKDWDDVISIRIGGEYALGESWALRAGYVWDQSPVPDTTRSPELPGSDRQMLMAGVGWKSGGLGIDLAYSYLWAEDADMGTIITSVAPPLAGTFETVTHLVGLSASYSF
jgi:long-chain fatty acid transport protein